MLRDPLAKWSVTVDARRCESPGDQEFRHRGGRGAVAVKLSLPSQSRPLCIAFGRPTGDLS
jgi:hypothetical protein